MTTTSLEGDRVARHLIELKDQQATGELLVTAGEQEWKFYFYLGHLLYAAGGRHRCRRWYRALKQYRTDLTIKAGEISSDLWEYHILRKAVSQGRLNVAQAKAVMGYSTLEVLFSLFGDREASNLWKPSTLHPDRVSSTKLHLSIEVEKVLDKSEKLWSQWQGMGLSYLCPDLAPILKQPGELPARVKTEQSQTLTAFFNGQSPIWDIALEMKQSLTTLCRSLHHFLKQGIIELQPLPDLLPPIESSVGVKRKPRVKSSAKRSKPLIACIDDSPLVGSALEQILVPAGYRVIKIQDPMLGVAILAEQKPDLILLDVVMPHATGYTLCSFLRQTSLFGSTPIIMLTSRDYLIDRTKAKLAGASDFLTKPTDSTKILQMIEKYLSIIKPGTNN